MRETEKDGDRERKETHTERERESMKDQTCVCALHVVDQTYRGKASELNN